MSWSQSPAYAQPHHLTEELRQHLKALGMEYNSQNKEYATVEPITVEEPRIMVRVEERTKPWRSVRVVLLLDVLRGASTYRQRIDSENIRISEAPSALDKMLSRNGYSPEAIVRRRKLRALIA